MKKTYFITLLVSIALLAFASCASTPVYEEGMTAAQLIQNGQSEFENSNYKNALFWYEKAIEHYGTDGAVYVEAKYEIGHIYMKQKKYREATLCFDELVDIFEKTPVGALPAAFNKLSKKELEKIPASELAKARNSK